MSSTAREHLIVGFVDIADSVGLYRREGDARAQRAVDHALAIAADAVAGVGGQVIKRSGDDLLLAFGDANAALAGAAAIQRSSPLDVRIGLHAGNVLLRDSDAFGNAVNIAARLTAVARAREVLISRFVYARLRRDLRDQCRRFENLRLKGIDTRLQLYHLCWEEGEHTRMETQHVEMAETGAEPRQLMLQFGDASFAVQNADVCIGRDPTCDVVIDHPRVSRFHATVERRRGRFVIRDHSTNGSLVQAPGASQPTFIRREEHPLLGVGTLSFGHADPACSVRYKLA